jgi:hypothetical protein
MHLLRGEKKIMQNKRHYWSARTRTVFLAFSVFMSIFSIFLGIPIRTHAAATTNCPSGTSCGSYSISRLGMRKQQILKSGATTLDLAVAMLETDTMQAGFYPYGDGKTNDATNFGVFKQNWYMLRNACSSFSGRLPTQYNSGAILNASLSTDIACLNQSQRFYGTNIWFAGERYGQTGLSNPNLPDITRYKTAVYWIQNQLTSRPTNLSNNTRFWVAVPSI